VRRAARENDRTRREKEMGEEKTYKGFTTLL
jgi:hypothetical protein